MKTRFVDFPLEGSVSIEVDEEECEGMSDADVIKKCREELKRSSNGSTDYDVDWDRGAIVHE